MYLGIDFGTKRIGLALGEIFPKGAGVIDGTKNIEKVIDEIDKICQENNVSQIIVGLPLLPSGDESKSTHRVREFGRKLKKKTSIEVVFEEEELTSVEAERLLKERGSKYSKETGKVDELAAILILEQYINNKNH